MNTRCTCRATGPILYMTKTSPPVLSILITAAAIGLDLELIPVNLAEEEQMKVDFIKVTMSVNLRINVKITL